MTDVDKTMMVTVHIKENVRFFILVLAILKNEE